MNGYKGNKKVGVLFSGGPAPSADAVISAVGLSFLNKKVPIIGIYYGFEFLELYDPHHRFSLVEGTHYEYFDHSISRIRNRRGVYLKTSRANPGKNIKCKADLQDPEKNEKLRNILYGLDSLGIGYLITIGGDDALKTANYLSLMEMPVIHIPKTIDNDYHGISWTFGFWSAVQNSKDILLNLKADAESTNSYFIVELMGRKAGWITYASAIAGEAVMSVSLEDIDDPQLDMEKLANQIVDVIIQRERKQKHYGIICVAEGLADKLPPEHRPTEKDRHGNIIFGTAEIGKILKDFVVKKYKERTGRIKKVIAKQVGYETRNISPISFDVVLGSMLGFGAFRLYEKQQFSSMVSVSNDFQIIAVPFDELIDHDTLLTKLRNVHKGSDFYELKEALSFKTDD